jgi:hypothetical protein
MTSNATSLKSAWPYELSGPSLPEMRLIPTLAPSGFADPSIGVTREI